MYDNEFIVFIWSMRMGIDCGRFAVCCPTCMRNTTMHIEFRFTVQMDKCFYVLFKFVHAAFLTRHFAWSFQRVAEAQLIASVERNTGWIVASILQASQAIQQCLDYVFTLFGYQIIQVAKNSLFYKTKLTNVKANTNSTPKDHVSAYRTFSRICICSKESPISRLQNEI